MTETETVAALDPEAMGDAERAIWDEIMARWERALVTSATVATGHGTNTVPRTIYGPTDEGPFRHRALCDCWECWGN